MESVVVVFIAEQRYLCDVRQVREGVTGIGGVGLKVLPRFLTCGFVALAERLTVLFGVAQCSIVPVFDPCVAHCFR